MKKEEDELKAKAIAAQAQATPLKIMAQVTPESPINNVFGALDEGNEDSKTPDIPAEVA